MKPADLPESGPVVKSNSKYIKHSSYGGRTVLDRGCCFCYVQYDEKLQPAYQRDSL